jgi:hypothetical protein
MDAHKNLAYSTIATNPSPAASGTTLNVQSGHGARFPDTPFNCTVWPLAELPTPTNAEIVRVTSKGSGDDWTILRAQENTNARAMLVGDQIAATITAKTLTDIEDALSTESSARAAKDDALSQSVSVVSNALSVETTARVAADNALSNAVSVVSQALSVALVSIAVVSNAVSVEAAARVAKDDALSQAISVVSQAVSLEVSNRISADNALSVRIDAQSQLLSALSQKVSTLSQGLSLLSNTNSAEHAALSARIDLGGGTASVTSNELSAVSAQAASALSQALSVLSVTDAALSNRISVASAVASAADVHASVASLAVTSVDGRVNSVNAFISGISARSAGASTHGLQSVVNALSHTISALSQAVSVADAALSNRISIASAVASAADVHASVASLAVTSVDGRVNSVNAFLSGISALSAGGVSTHGLQSVINALSNRISATAGGTGSVTSTELSAVSAQAASALSAALNVSVKSVGGTSVKGLQSVVNALSDRVSVITPQFATVSNPAGYTVAATNLTTVSGLSVSISPGASYQLYAHLMYVVLSAAQPTGFGFITDAAAIAVAYGRAMGDVSLVVSAGGDALSTTRGLLHFWNQAHFGGTTAIFSVNPGTASPVVHGVIIEGVVACSATMSANQRIHIAARASSGATGGVIVTAGSYIRILRII